MNRLGAMAIDLAEGIRARPGRTLAAAATIAAGWMLVGLTLAALTHLRERARRIAEEFGEHCAVVVPAPAADGRRPGRDLVASCRAAVPAVTWSGVLRQPGGLDGSGPPALLVDEHFLPTRGWRLREGRGLDPLDVAHGAAVILATEPAAAGWRVGEARPGGDGRLWTLIGVVAADASQTTPALLHPSWPLLLLPWTARPEVWIEAIHARAGDEAGLRTALAAAAAAMDEAGFDAEAATVVTTESLTADLRRWQRRVGSAAGAAAAAVLALGGVALAGTLLADARARISEIGLRRALGARPRDIAALFVAEAAVLTMAGAAAGLGAARGLVAAVGAPMRRGLPADLAAIVAAAAMAAALAAAPAIAAARTPPAEALRND